MRRHHLLPALFIASLSATPGCGGGNTIWITGKLLKGGAQYAPPEDQKVTITFVGLETKDPSGKTVQGGDPYQAEYDPSSGTFIVPGPERRGILPGKYRVAVTQRMERTSFDAAREEIKDKARKKAFTRETDMLANQFGPNTSPIVVDVNESGDVTIDLAQSSAPGDAARK